MAFHKLLPHFLPAAAAQVGGVPASRMAREPIDAVRPDVTEADPDHAVQQWAIQCPDTPSSDIGKYLTVQTQAFYDSAFRIRLQDIKVGRWNGHGRLSNSAKIQGLR